jgi:peptide chain release factor 1
MLPREKVQNLIDRHLKLEKELSAGEIEKKKFAEISKEYSDLNDIIKPAKEFLSFEKDIEDLKNIINDKNSDLEMKDFASSELENLKNNYQQNEKKIKLFLLPKDLADSKNAIIEIRAGTGGLEASLFASDLYKMYEKVSQKKSGLLRLSQYLKAMLED